MSHKFELSVIVVYESPGCPRCEKMDLEIVQSLLERVQIQKNAAKSNFSETFFRRRADSLTVQDKQGRQTITKQQTQLWIIQVTTQY